MTLEFHRWEYLVILSCSECRDQFCWRLCDIVEVTVGWPDVYKQASAL